MTLNELIEKLQQLQAEGYGELNVYLWADHGQTPSRVHCTGLSYIESEGYIEDFIHPDDLEDYPDAIPVVEIS